MHDPGPHYTFGDDSLAATRLALLARAYEPATRDFLKLAGVPEGSTVVDLGCGPGHSTRLLDEVIQPAELIGLDTSRTFLELARSTNPAHTRFIEHDVASKPLPVPPGCWLFCRFLLTHLPEPDRVLDLWARSVCRGGLLIMETAELRSDIPALARYYELVGTLQAHYGQDLRIGDRLADIAAAAGWTVRIARRAEARLPVAMMARLHAMNLRTWRSDPFAATHFDADELDRLEQELEAAARDLPDATVDGVLGEAVLTCG